MDQKYYYAVGEKIVGGSTPWEDQHSEGIAVRIDAENRSAEVVEEYNSPPELRPTDERVYFNCSSVRGDKLYTCTESEILTYSLPEVELVNRITRPFFKNIHHVRRTDDGTLMAIVGQLDTVMEFTPEGEVLEEWSVIDHDPWEEYSRTEDIRRTSRRASDELPDQYAHPNWLFELDGQWWVTRYHQKDAICLTDSRPPMRIDVGTPHDGEVHDGEVYFTTTDGQLIVCDAETGKRTRRYDLKELSDADSRLGFGFTRGLSVIDERYVVVGISNIRMTYKLGNIAFALISLFNDPISTAQDYVNRRPTRIAKYDLQEGRECWAIDLNEQGIGQLYSFHHVSEDLVE